MSFTKYVLPICKHFYFNFQIILLMTIGLFTKYNQFVYCVKTMVKFVGETHTRNTQNASAKRRSIRARTSSHVQGPTRERLNRRPGSM